MRDNGDVVATDSRLVTSQEIIDGAFIFEPIRTSLSAMSDGPLFPITGMVTAEVGVDAAPDGSWVRVTNLSRSPNHPIIENRTSEVSDNPVTNAITNGAYTAVLQSIDFTAYKKGDVANTGDILLVEVVDPDGVVLGAKEFTLDSQSVSSKDPFNADVHLTGVVIALTIDGEPVDGTLYENHV